uniref:Uncharacterized protein n=1 Tax=Globodera rostochiensis TaxID=31243 RepID=A0A914GYR2_GLORO
MALGPPVTRATKKLRLPQLIAHFGQGKQQLEGAVNRSLRLINRRACANTVALNKMAGQLEVFGEDSVIAFDEWAERFGDYVGAVGRSWSDDEKIARLKMSLIGTPRQLFKQLTAAESANIGLAIRGIRLKLDSPQRRELTKRTLSLCKQRENETVSDFLKRLSPLVEMVNPSLNEQQRKEKVFGLNSVKDLDRVKAQAEELESLLLADRGQMPDSLGNTVQALSGQRAAFQQQVNNNNLPRMRPQFVSEANSTPFGNRNRNFNGTNQFGQYRNQNDRRPNNQQMQSQRRWSNRPRLKKLTNLQRKFKALRVHVSQNLNHPIRKRAIWLYKPNAFQYEADAWACRKVQKNAQKHTSLSNVPIIEKLDPDQLDVEREECQQMIAHQKCSFGTLTKDGELFHTDNKIDLTPPGKFPKLHDFHLSTRSTASVNTLWKPNAGLYLQQQRNPQHWLG